MVTALLRDNGLRNTFFWFWNLDWISAQKARSLEVEKRVDNQCKTAYLWTAGGAWYGGGWAPGVKLWRLIGVTCESEPADGEMEGDNGAVLSLEEVGEVVAVDVVEDEDDGEHKPGPSPTSYIIRGKK